MAASFCGAVSGFSSFLYIFHVAYCLTTFQLPDVGCTPGPRQSHPFTPQISARSQHLAQRLGLNATGSWFAYTLRPDLVDSYQVDMHRCMFHWFSIDTVSSLRLHQTAEGRGVWNSASDQRTMRRAILHPSARWKPCLVAVEPYGDL